MFERYIAKPRKPRPWVVAFLSVSVVSHVAVAVVLLVAAMWQIDKIAPPDQHVVMVVPTRLPIGDAPPPAKHIKKKLTKQTKHKPRVTVQPTNEIPPEKDIEIEYPGDDEFGEENGTPNGVIGGTGTNPNGLVPLGDAPVIPKMESPPALPKQEAPTEITEQQFKARLESGDQRILPPNSVRLMMARRGESQIQGLIRLCLNTRGSVTSAKVRRSTSYKEYDDKLVAEMRKWRYEPYRVGNKAVSVCTFITLIYRQIN